MREHKQFYFYDPLRTYDDNVKEGPFGDRLTTNVEDSTRENYSFLGYSVSLPFGIPAGPLPTSRHVIAAWEWGYPIATYKTVRGTDYPCHPFPNVIKVSSEGDIYPGQTVIGDMNLKDVDVTHQGITNSFGVPSVTAEVWENCARSNEQRKTTYFKFYGYET